MTKLKICGLRDVSNAREAASAGADYLGFVFVQGVPRQLSVDKARTIIEECRLSVDCSGTQMVGLFADQPIGEVNSIVESCRLDLVQLCGDEVSEYWQSVTVPVIKQVKVRDYLNISVATDDVLRRVGEVVALGYTAVLDKYESGTKGGTGLTFDWNIAAEVAKRYDFLLAGGLTSDNVGVAIDTVCPWGVDVSSGVETDLVKDTKKIYAFAAEVAATGLKRSWYNK